MWAGRGIHACRFPLLRLSKTLRQVFSCSYDNCVCNPCQVHAQMTCARWWSSQVAKQSWFAQDAFNHMAATLQPKRPHAPILAAPDKKGQIMSSTCHQRGFDSNLGSCPSSVAQGLTSEPFRAMPTSGPKHCSPHRAPVACSNPSIRLPLGGLHHAGSGFFDLSGQAGPNNTVPVVGLRVCHLT